MLQILPPIITVIRPVAPQKGIELDATLRAIHPPAVEHVEPEELMPPVELLQPIVQVEQHTAAAAQPFAVRAHVLVQPWRPNADDPSNAGGHQNAFDGQQRRIGKEVLRLARIVRQRRQQPGGRPQLLVADRAHQAAVMSVLDDGGGWHEAAALGAVSAIGVGQRLDLSEKRRLLLQSLLERFAAYSVIGSDSFCVGCTVSNATLVAIAIGGATVELAGGSAVVEGLAEEQCGPVALAVRMIGRIVGDHCDV